MTKSQLIAEVAAKAWFGGLIGELVMEENWASENAKLYRGHVKILKTGNVLKTAHIYFYVLNEGVAGEVAYYKDLTPDEQVA